MGRESYKIAVIIPVYKEQLTKAEMMALEQGRKIFSNYELILVGPVGLDLTSYQLKLNNDCRVELFNSKYFRNIKGYNRLLLHPRFYKRFLQYEYMLIYQLDAFVFEDQLEYWCRLGYDYIGAPFMDPQWMKELDYKVRFPISKWINVVGNGGLSLRKVETFYWAAIVLFPITRLWIYNEDFFWSTVGARLYPGFRIPDKKIALQFAFEEKPSLCYELNNNKLPFGCHAWEKYDPEFWKIYIRE